MLGYMSAVNAKAFQNRFSDIRFLLGDFRVEVYSYRESEGWYHSGQGESKIYIEDNVMFESLQLTKEHTIVHIQNTIVFDHPSNQYKLMSLDLAEGSIDTYQGVEKAGVLTFHNYKDPKVSSHVEYVFKLIYKEISDNTLSLIIGCSKDQGKTWLPFVKNLYHRSPQL